MAEALTAQATPTAGVFELTNEQSRAIELMPQHNLQIIACAGSGKTEIVSRGISEIIKTGVKPSEIVAFTFTEKAAEELKGRVRLTLRQDGKGAGVSDMYVGTIHSYCFEELKRLRPEFRGFDVLDEASRVAYISKPYIYYNKLKLKPFEQRGKSGHLSRYTVIGRFIRTLDMVLDEGISLARIRRHDAELADAIEAYRSALQTDRYLDFSTMIHQLVSLLEDDSSARAELRKQVKHLVVDEYQDVNGLQQKLIRMMVGPQTRIAVVGDDDQSIYWWRGAVVDFLIEFRKNFKAVKTARLEANFRSTEGVVALGRDFISLNGRRLEKKMVAKNPFKSKHDPPDMQYRHFGTERQQGRFVVDRIKELVGADFVDKRGNPYALSHGDIAVLIRSNEDIQRFLPILDDARITYVVDSGEIVFEQPIVQLVRDCLDWIFALNDSPIEHWVRDYFRLLDERGYSGVSKKDVRARLKALRAVLDKIREKSPKDYLRDLGLQGVFHEMLEAIGLSEMAVSEPDHYYVATLSRAVSDYETVWQRLRHTEYKYFRGFIQAWGQYSYSVATRSDIQPINAVKVMTIHKAKGLEFPVVFMPYLNQKRKGRGPDVFLAENLYDSERYKGDGEDERRVYYVALTRAEKYLFLSGMRDDPTVENERHPAEFIGELRQDLLHDPEPLVLKKSGLVARKRDLHDFSTTFSELSAYGRCGYDYKLRHVYGYNAGVPVAFGYGTQIHNILNIIHQKYRDKPLSPQEVEQLIQKHFYLRYAPGNINEAMQKAATRVVLNYVAGHSGEFKRVLETEKAFEFTLGNSLVTGQIDLIKKMDEAGELQEVELVDFKSDHGLLYKTDFEHQLRLYVMASIDALGLKPKKAVVHDLEQGEKHEVDIAVEKLQETRTLLNSRVDGIRAGQFQPANNKGVCSGCDYSRICIHCKS